MSVKNLLIEIGTEELPPKSLRKLAEAFRANMLTQMEKLALNFDTITWYAAPRRLVLHVEALHATQPDKVVEKRGPAVTSAFDADGNPTKAALGWARGNGITVEEADRLETEKGAWLFHKATVKGRHISELLPAAINEALHKLPIPKLMRWGDSRTQFVRPVHTATVLFGSDIIAGNILDVAISNKMNGHRFHTDEQVTITHADDYLKVMREAWVVADYEERKTTIRSQVEAAASEHNGVAVIDEDLLEEVTSLVEWPETLVGSFEERFLSVPSEALIYTMQDNQKYFALKDEQGNLLPKFIFVSNIKSKDPVQVIEGNEKVIRPRLADADFFFETDKKKTLESRLESLETVLFEKRLGSLKDKSDRISALAAWIATEIGADAELSARAGLLSKTDLMTEMVMEFTDIQGVMGMYYARHDGEHEDVALALNQQYQPRFSGDVLPENLVSCAVAIADKVDTLVGIFGIGQQPKADKDPYALRRAAIGALRIIVEKSLPLDLTTLLAKGEELYGDKLTQENTTEAVIDFMLARFNTWYQDAGIDVDVIQAVQVRRPTRPVDFHQRVNAVNVFRKLEEAQSLAAANKRVANILAKFDGDLPEAVNDTLLSEEAEKALAKAVADKQDSLASAFDAGDYQTVLTELATLRTTVDDFFDNVMVMAEDDSVKQNRLALLNGLRNLFLRVADISLLQS